MSHPCATTQVYVVYPAYMAYLVCPARLYGMSLVWSVHNTMMLLITHAGRVHALLST